MSELEKEVEKILNTIDTKDKIPYRKAQRMCLTAIARWVYGTLQVEEIKDNEGVNKLVFNLIKQKAQKAGIIK